MHTDCSMQMHGKKSRSKDGVCAMLLGKPDADLLHLVWLRPVWSAKAAQMLFADQAVERSWSSLTAEEGLKGATKHKNRPTEKLSSRICWHDPYLQRKRTAKRHFGWWRHQHSV